MRSTYALGGFAIGAVVGAALMRSDHVFDWVANADWSQLPTTVVGTTIPALAGVLFASAFSRNSAKAIARGQLEAQAEFAEVDARARESGREQRRRCWDRLYDAVKRTNDQINASRLVSQARSTATQRRKDANRRGENIECGHATVIAATSVVGDVLRRNLAGIAEEVRELVISHGVSDLLVAVEAFDLLEPVVKDAGRWPTGDLEEILADAIRHGGKDPTWLENVANEAREVLTAFESLANRYRVRPSDPSDLDRIVSRRTLRGQVQVDILREFAHLHDLLEQDPGPSVSTK